MEGHGRSWKVMEDHGRSWKVMEGHGRSFPDTRLTGQVRKVIGGVGWGGGLQDYIVIHQSHSFPMDFGFLIMDWTWS